ncbi:hypothetical protein VNO80_22201 [Phaseolus coccineus]|uniref:Uncharacterized protein n=1 Tax=Phaseolus coccineus TaxID=3886 RepID=A0AAN9M7L3_PHACN
MQTLSCIHESLASQSPLSFPNQHHQQRKNHSHLNLNFHFTHYEGYINKVPDMHSIQDLNHCSLLFHKDTFMALLKVHIISSRHFLPKSVLGERGFSLKDLSHYCKNITGGSMNKRIGENLQDCSINRKLKCKMVD